MAVLTVGSLFSGIGGLELGLERAGMTVKWQVEIDEYCNKILAKHWPNVARYRDVREIGAHNLEPVDLICGGFPCQPHSLAGQRKGKDDERNLWPEYLRIVTELRPAWVLGENVPGIRTTILDDILDDLEGLGYATRTFDIPACAVGAPHLRHRFFIVAHADGAGCQEQRWPVAMAQEQRAAECGGAEMADTNSRRRQQCDTTKRSVPESDEDNSERRNATDADREPAGWATESWGECGQRAVEPNVGGVADGLSAILDGLGEQWRYGEWPGLSRVSTGVKNRVDRLRCLGNAVVPQVAELIGRMIVAADGLSL